MSDILGPNEHAKATFAGESAETRGGLGSGSESAGQCRRKVGRIAAMGLAWAQAINTRIVLQRCCQDCGTDQPEPPGNIGSAYLGLRQV